MFTIIKDLFRFSPSFRYGSIILVLMLIMVVLSYFSPYEPDAMRVVPTNRAPSAEHILGTTSTGQDIFWMLTFAIRNSMIVAGMAVLIGRSIGVPLGLISGYMGGGVDRVISSIVDSIIVIPRLPLLILIAALIRGQLTLLSLGIMIGLLDWAFPSKRYRAQVLSLREREFTNTAVFSGMNTWKIVLREHLPFIIPYLLADAVSGFLFAIGFEVTLSTLGLSQMTSQSIGTMIYWGNYYNALLAKRYYILTAPVITTILMVVGLYMMSTGISNFLDPRSRLARMQVKE
jgi:peptide/nickel transport system permease protein